MTRSFRLCFALAVALSLPLTGCGKGKATVGPSVSNEAVEVSDEKTEAVPLDAPELDETPLDSENPDTPEGVVNMFFKTFFSGDDDGAFALLTSRAQRAKREHFNAQESDTVRWRITKKMKPVRGRVLVQVEVEDYTETGAIQLDELTFVLTNDDYVWRIAGFSVGELAINFEEQASDDEEYYVKDDEDSAPARTARAIESSVLVR